MVDEIICLYDKIIYDLLNGNINEYGYDVKKINTTLINFLPEMLQSFLKPESINNFGFAQRIIAQVEKSLVMFNGMDIFVIIDEACISTKELLMEYKEMMN